MHGAVSIPPYAFMAWCLIKQTELYLFCLPIQHYVILKFLELFPISEFAGIPTTHRVTGKAQNNDKLCFCELCVPLCRKCFYSFFRGRGRLQHRYVWFVLKTYPCTWMLTQHFTVILNGFFLFALTLHALATFSSQSNWLFQFPASIIKLVCFVS